MFKSLRDSLDRRFPADLTLGQQELHRFTEAVAAKALATGNPVECPTILGGAVYSRRITVEQALSVLDKPDMLLLVSILGGYQGPAAMTITNPDGVNYERKDAPVERATDGEVSSTRRDRASLVAEFISSMPSDPEDEDFRLGLVAIRDYLRAKGGGAYGLKAAEARAIGTGLFTVKEVVDRELAAVWQIMDVPGPTYVIDQDGTVTERVNVPPEQVTPSWTNKERPDLTLLPA